MQGKVGHKMKQKRAALYVRVSSGEQHTEMQERALREYVQRRGWLQHKIYRDKLTGATTSRPGLDEMLNDCRRRAVDVVVVWKFDRFARSLKNLIAGLDLCRALGIDFVSVTEAVGTSWRDAIPDDWRRCPVREITDCRASEVGSSKCPSEWKSPGSATVA